MPNIIHLTKKITLLGTLFILSACSGILSGTESISKHTSCNEMSKIRLNAYQLTQQGKTPDQISTLIAPKQASIAESYYYQLMAISGIFEKQSEASPDYFKQCEADKGKTQFALNQTSLGYQLIIKSFVIQRDKGLSEDEAKAQLTESNAKSGRSAKQQYIAKMTNDVNLYLLDQVYQNATKSADQLVNQLIPQFQIIID